MPTTDRVQAGTAPGSPRRARRSTWWVVCALAIGIGGVAASWAGASAWQREVERNAEREEVRVANDVSGRAAETVRRAMDMTTSFRAALASGRGMDQSGFDRWIGMLDPYRRIPSLQALGFAVADPAAAASGSQARCPLAIVSTADGSVLVPVGTDLCQAVPAISTAFGRAIDSGELIMGVLESDDASTQPVLVGGAVYDEPLPPDVEGRRRSVVGWAGLLFDGEGLVRHARGTDHDRVWLQISHQVVGEPVAQIGAVGPRPRSGDVRVRTVEGDGRWLIAVAAAPFGGVSAQSQGRAVLVAGVAVSLLLSLLLLVLSRSRDRALLLVARKTDELLHQALHDPLTDLPNRTLIMERVEEQLGRHRAEGAGCAVMFIDLDDFKDINDTAGHDVGDAVLQAVAGRLARSVRPGDTVGRLGGDEFVVLLPDEEAAVGVAERILEALRSPYRMDGPHPLHVGASIGIATGGRPTSGELLRDADVALYNAKATGRGRIVVFETAMGERVQERLDLETALRDAVVDRQLFLVYQPILDLREVQVTGVEALVRWRHPQRGVLAPDTFIPLAEQSGLIIEMGRWVLAEACRQGARWRAAGVDLDVAVNVSAKQLDTDDLIDHVRSALETSGFPASSLTIEVTETALMLDTDAAMSQMRALKDLGVTLAIDDFGTGYSSLAYLQQFPVDQLKIDRSFIAAMSGSSEATSLISTLVQLGRTLGIATVAEGIEEADQRDLLRLEECDLGQGYLFTRPLVAEAIIPFIDRWGAVPAPSLVEPAS